jgi:peptide/nickel transport system substrate-binding protein
MHVMRPFVALSILIGIAGLASAETLTLAVSVNVTTLDPHMTSTEQTNLSVASHIYSPLMIRGPDLKLQASVAESWHAVDDRTWRIKLRQGVQFAHGESLDAEAVKWNLDRILNPANKIHNRPWFDPISEVKVVGSHEIELVASKPYPSLPEASANASA